MGLADSNKKKQKISEDPRNTKWATDEKRPGFKMLLKMGWSPSHAATLTPEGPIQSKRLTSIPVAKEDTIGLGAAPNGPSASSIFSKFGSKGLSFVTASKDGSVQVMKDRNSLTEGGHFAGLLERLNAANKSAATTPSPTPTPAAEPASPAPEPAVATPKVVTSNPRNASRAKFLRAKAMAKSDPSDMAGILGYSPFPTPSASTSAASSPAPTPQRVPEPEAPTTEAQPEKDSKDKKKKKRKIDDISESTDVKPESDSMDSGSAKKQSKKEKKKKKKEANIPAQSEDASETVAEPAGEKIEADADESAAQETKEERRERKRRKKEAKEAQKRASAE